MDLVKTGIEGVLIIEPRLFRNARGNFFESFSELELEEKVAPILGNCVHLYNKQRLHYDNSLILIYFH